MLVIHFATHTRACGCDRVEVFRWTKQAELHPIRLKYIAKDR